jgi:hypothetical protein
MRLKGSSGLAFVGGADDGPGELAGFPLHIDFESAAGVD